MTYKLVYNMCKDEMTGFSTVSEAVAECSSWSEEQIAMTEDIDGFADMVINEETDEVVCYLENKEAVCDQFNIVPGQSFLSGLTNVGTYSSSELDDLK